MGQTSSNVADASHNSPTASRAGQACPVQHHQPSPASAAKCPVAHDQINPHNQMPVLSQTPSPEQDNVLPTERTTSSIPRSDPEPGAPRVWEYPSPQQFYNALVRKGWETPEEHVETMVVIHNHLNEEAWKEVLKWEHRWTDGSSREPELERLQGRPGELSPKARMLLLAGRLFPSRFNSEPPFDRHDWVIKRPGSGERVRYVIDYYSAPPESDGSPVFSLDVRPALDSLGSVKERISFATREAWDTFRQGTNPVS